MVQAKRLLTLFLILRWVLNLDPEVHRDFDAFVDLLVKPDWVLGAVRELGWMALLRLQVYVLLDELEFSGTSLDNAGKNFFEV